MRSILLIAVLAVTPLACGGEAGAGGPGGPGGPGKGRRGGEAEALAVAVTTLSPATIERHYRGAGTLRALRAADLVALQPGVVLDLRAEEGDSVAEGQLLARLDGRAYQLQAARDKLSAQNAAKELQRLEQLSGLLSREELDKQRYAAESALASSQVSRHQASQTTVSAPFAGTITRRHIDVGNLATTSKSLYTIADLSALDLELHVPEREASAVQAGAPAVVELQDGTRFEARVERRAPVVDPLTGTVKFVVRARNFPAGAVPGAFARATLRVAIRESAPSVPRGAIVEVEGKPHVYVVEDGRARRRPVELGLVGEERAEIRGGVAEGAQIVVDAGTGIAEGMPVRAVAEGAGKGESKAESGAAKAEGAAASPAGSAGQAAQGSAGQAAQAEAGQAAAIGVSAGAGPSGQVPEARSEGAGAKGQVPEARAQETGPKGQAAAATPGVR
ncbi:efflux RND transporter periplasmic adaptor subunit [Nannocystis sp. ILAH1]|uniref:efflux RND transporter periplasmic adaptor subunit n=1 Tax=unclassified Nannocystis TaxID=2627009 RepID=UPI00226DAF4D|nr:MULTISPECIES: efflux RND transporter periplasmic adaptor subunit [unclassified Nannocystis]MCY0985832.1 efflux RND transporter periplasmic adaptor subunit [Nannocystis sp. ILAH1]MCY1068467.1 efflux RND transporter periplasmic adaptor subunit [Nannocystis sp. RBIL2]